LALNEAFSGLGHPAVVTVMAVLVCSRGLQNSGAIDWMARWFTGVGQNLMLQLAALCGLVGLLSAFMNNIGASSDPHASCHQHGAQIEAIRGAVPDAIGFQRPLWRYDYADWNTTKLNHISFSSRGHWVSRLVCLISLPSALPLMVVGVLCSLPWLAGA
jgi:hypothetical protein